MLSYTEIPVHTAAPAPQRKHQRTRHYARRVKESLTSRVARLLCSCFIGLLLILGLIAFVLWLSLRPHRPRFHVTDFSVSTGITPVNGLQNAAIAFNASARNPNQNVGFYYDEIDGAVYYNDQKIGSVPLLHPFYQQPKNTTNVTGILSQASLTVAGDIWNQNIASGMVAFRLELTSMIRFKVTTWVSRRHRITASCDVTVGSDGQILATSKNKRCPLYFS